MPDRINITNKEALSRVGKIDSWEGNPDSLCGFDDDFMYTLTKEGGEIHFKMFYDSVLKREISSKRFPEIEEDYENAKRIALERKINQQN